MSYADEEAWREQAACRGVDPRIFIYPEAAAGRPRKDGEGAIARRICATCPVQDECLEASEFATPNHNMGYRNDGGRTIAPGIWSGKSYNERKMIFRQRRKASGEVHRNVRHLNQQKAGAA